VPQAVEIEGQSQQGCLALLHWQAASRHPGREFAFDDGEDRFHLGPLPVDFLRESSPHLSADAYATAPATLGRDDAARSRLSRPNFKLVPRMPTKPPEIPFLLIGRRMAYTRPVPHTRHRRRVFGV